MDDMLFTHGKDKNGQRFTLCMLNTTTTTVQVGLAVCHKTDNFSKKLGREISLGRAEVRPLAEVDLSLTQVEGNSIYKTGSLYLKQLKQTIEKDTVEPYLQRNCK